VTIYLDSADSDDARRAHALGLIGGVTTNPTLMARAGGNPLERLRSLLDALPDLPVAFQVEPTTYDEALPRALAVADVAPERMILKLPATLEHYRLAAELRRREIPVAMTAVYNVAQARLAIEVGARWIISYVDRAQRLRDGGDALIADIAAALHGAPDAPGLMAASLKSTEQVIRAFRDGADAVTVPLERLTELAHDELTEQAVTEFTDATRSAKK
jgi:transaldolase